MRILYGVVGEGMGHATRSHVVLERLLQGGHEIRVVVSGRAHRFLVERLQTYSNVTIEEIHGFRLSYFGNRLDKSDSFIQALRSAPEDLLQNLRVYRKVAEDGFRPEVVISDFESWAGLYGLNHFLPVVCLDNLHIIDRCRHEPAITAPDSFNNRLTRFAVQIKVPGTSHFLITSFFFPPVAKRRTTLLPPILRPAIEQARREPGDHVLVYQTSSSNDHLIPSLKRLPYRFRVYGMGRVGSEGNVELRAFSEQGFVDDLRTARAAIAGGGFTLLSEAVSLRIPTFSVPIEQQYEQELNARYLAHLGYGGWAPTIDVAVLEGFLARTDEFAHNLASYPGYDNEMLFACLDELFERFAVGDVRPDRLDSPAVGKWQDGGDEEAPQSE
jgi:uncharacterized protein (TIGR00661 family)